MLIARLIFCSPIICIAEVGGSTASIVVNYCGDTMHMSNEEYRTVKVGNSVRKFTTRKSTPEYLNSEEILFYTNIYDSKNETDSAFCEFYTSKTIL